MDTRVLGNGDGPAAHGAGGATRAGLRAPRKEKAPPLRGWRGARGERGHPDRWRPLLEAARVMRA